MAEQVFVARERELAQLNEFLDQALAGQGRVCFITGDAGSGKTALVTEFARRAQEMHADLLVAIGNCNAQTGFGDPYLPFREVLSLLTGDVEAKLAQGTISEENANRMRHLLVRSIQVLVDVGPHLVDVLIPASTLIAIVGKAVAEKVGWLDKLESLASSKPKKPEIDQPALEQSYIFEEYTKVIQTLAADQPLVIVLDDLQWADASSVGLLFHLGRHVGTNRILIIGTYRPEDVALGRADQRHPLESVVNELKRYFGEIEIDLSQPSEADARRLLNSLLDSEPNELGSDFRQALFELTGGHPLFTIELLKDMEERGALITDDQGRWVEAPALDWHTLPPRVEATIAERIRRLDHQSRETLTIASVEGEHFTAEVVARVQGGEEQELVRRLSGHLERQHRLVQAEGTRRLGRQRLSLYRFWHKPFHAYLYEGLDEAERSYLHEDVGDALETLYGHHTGEIAVQLAWHFEQAAIAEKAVDYLGRAGEQARQQYANEEAINHFRRALTLLQDAPPDASREKAATELYERLGDVLELTGQYDEARTAYQNALASLPALDRIGHARLHRKTGGTWASSRQAENAMQAYDKAEAALGQEPAEAAPEWWQEWVDIQLYRTNVHYFQGEVHELNELVDRIQPVVEQHGTPLQRADFFLRLVMVNNRRDRFIVSEQTLAHSQAYLEAAQELGSLHRIAHASFVLGFNLLWRGVFDEAKEQLNAALERAVRMGNTYRETQCLTYLTVVYRKLGQVEEAADYALRSLEAATSVQDLMYVGAARANLAWVAWKQANLTEALEKGKAALESWQQSETGFMFQWLSLFPLTSVTLAHDRILEAVEHARSLLEPAQQALPDTLETSLEAAIEAWDRGESAPARRHLERAIELALEMGYL